ncbi:MAG: protein adenylyltransferase SelO family protein, partial [Pseudomonadota bacterium]
PCAFMDGFEPEKKFSSIDQYGRYAYHMQPKIAHWNLAQLAISLAPLLGDDEEAAVEMVKGALDAYPDAFADAWLAEMRRKLGLTVEGEGDRMLAEDLFARMAGAKADFTLTFRGLADAAAGDDGPLSAQLGDGAGEWLAAWRHRIEGEGAAPASRAGALRRANPLYIPRNHLVEAAIAAAYGEDFAPFHALVDVLATPFDEQDGKALYAAPPKADEVVAATFCGT